MEGRSHSVMDTYKISFRKLTESGLARNSAIVFAGSMAANVFAYAYHLFMGRLLGPAGYGELSSLLSILYIFTVPLTVAQTVLVKFASGFKAHGSIGQSKSLFIGITKLFLLICLAGFPVSILIAPWITGFLHLPSSALFVLVYILFVFSLLSVPTLSMLQGYQRFIWISIFVSGAVIIKLAISIPFTAYGVYGVLLAAIIASIIIYILYFIPLAFILRVKRSPTRLSTRALFGFTVPALLTTLGITSIFSTDIILVRHFFPSDIAGLYAALAILGKIIFYASSAVAMVLFPVVAERTAQKGNTNKLVWSAIAGVAALSTALTVLYFLFPGIIIRLLFGNAYSGAKDLLGIFGIFLALFSVGNIVVTACLARGMTKIWIVPVVCAVIQIIGIGLMHDTVGSVIMLNIVVCIILVLGSVAYYRRAAYEKI